MNELVDWLVEFPPLTFAQRGSVVKCRLTKLESARLNVRWIG